MPKKAEQQITPTLINKAKPRNYRYEIRDSGLKGFMLRVSPTGKKYFYVEVERGSKIKIGDASIMTLTRAQRLALEKLNAYQNGERVETSRTKCPSLEVFIDKQYRTHARASYKTQQRGDEAADRILKALDADPSLKAKKLDKLAKLDVERWKRKRGQLVMPTTLKRDLGALSTAFNLAVGTHKFCSENPCQGVKVKVEDDPRVRFLSDDERNRLLKALNKRDRDYYKARANNAENRRKRGLPELSVGQFKDYLTPLTILVMNTGLRRSEALSLTWDNVEMNREPKVAVRAAMTKSSKTRYVNLNSKAVDILKRWCRQIGGEGYVFVHPVSGAMMNKAHRAWKKLMQDAQVEDFRFHDLRHDFASQLVMAGQPLYLVKELLGHGSLEMTERYAHLADEAKAKAVEVLV